MMNAIWNCPAQLGESPAWHGEQLMETERALRTGEVEFIDWERAKQLLRERPLKAD
jgi:hypothetical protein